MAGVDIARQYLNDFSTARPPHGAQRSNPFQSQ